MLFISHRPHRETWSSPAKRLGPAEKLNPVLPRNLFLFSNIFKKNKSMERFKQKVMIEPVGSTNLKITLDLYEEVPLRADIEMNSGKLGTISGSELEHFLLDLRTLIKNYAV